MKFSGFQGALLRQRSAKVASETPNAATNRIWRPPNRELSDRGRGLLVEPLANHQRESREQGHRVRQHHANALLPHNAVDEALKCARLGSAIPWAAATPAVSADNVLPAHTGSSGDPTPEAKTAVSSSSAEDAVHGLDYGPRNTKEK